MISRLNRIIIIFFLLVLNGCSFYSFKGSIPGHIKSVYIAPIDNTTMESSVSDIIKFELEQSFITENVLKLLSIEDSDSRIDVSVTSFTDLPYDYDIDDLDATGHETVNAYEVTIRAKVKWHDIENDLNAGIDDGAIQGYNTIKLSTTELGIELPSGLYLYILKNENKVLGKEIMAVIP